MRYSRNLMVEAMSLSSTEHFVKCNVCNSVIIMDEEKDLLLIKNMDGKPHRIYKCLCGEEFDLDKLKAAMT